MSIFGDDEDAFWKAQEKNKSYKKEYPVEYTDSLEELLRRSIIALQQSPNVSYNYGRLKNLSSWALANEIELTLKEEVT